MSSASFARSTYNRAVHLRITPRPSNIGEAREILRLISQFGPVDHFRNLKYDALSAPNAAIVIFKDEEAATACLKRSPIRFRLGPASEADAEQERQKQYDPPAPAAVKSAPLAQESRMPSGAPFGLGPTTHSRSLSTASSALPTPPRKDPPMPFLPSSSPFPPPQSRIFQIQTNPARKQFRDQIDHKQYHGYFALDTNSVIQLDLAKRVPASGLSCWDWRKEDKLWRVLDREKRAERQGEGRRRSLGEIFEEGKGRDGEV